MDCDEDKSHSPSADCLPCWPNVESVASQLVRALDKIQELTSRHSEFEIRLHQLQGVIETLAIAMCDSENPDVVAEDEH